MTSFNTDNDADLLAFMGMAKDDPPLARAAWGEFFTRHRAYLFAIVRKRFGRFLGGDDGAEDVVIDAFQNAHTWAVNHAHENGAIDGFQASTPEEIRLKVRRWLGAIAENIFKSILDEKDREAEALKCAADEANARATATPPRPELLNRVQEALAELRPEDREVLTLSLSWYDGAGQFTPGRGDAQALANELGVEVDAFRQRRHRALARLKKALTAEPVAAPRQGAKK